MPSQAPIVVLTMKNLLVLEDVVGFTRKHLATLEMVKIPKFRKGFTGNNLNYVNTLPMKTI